MKTWLALGLMVLADSAGNVFLAHGMKDLGQASAPRPREALKLLDLAIRSPMLGAGVLCMAVAFFLFVAMLSRADLSVVLPATASGYALSAVGARYVLKEAVTRARWIGIALVCAGVALVSIGSGLK